MGAPSGHHGCRSGIDQTASGHEIVVGVGKHHESLLDQDLGSLEQARVVGEKGLLVSDDLQLSPSWKDPASRPSRAARTASSRL